jgi:two-component system response regulator FixJ
MAHHQHSAVAVVDDDPAVLDSLKFLLEVAGHKVVIYTSAVAFLQDEANRISCLIVDQYLPQMTGLESWSGCSEMGRALRSS